MVAPVRDESEERAGTRPVDAPHSPSSSGRSRAASRAAASGCATTASGRSPQPASSANWAMCRAYRRRARRSAAPASMSAGTAPDQHSRLGNLTRQGSPQLRWASYEAAQTACKPRSPDCGHYRCGTGSRRSPSSRAPDPKLAPLAVSRLDERDQLGLVGGVVESVGARHHRTDVTPDTQRGASAATRQPQGAWEPASGPLARPASCYRPLLSAPRRSGAM
jgi:hypothetical protein